MKKQQGPVVVTGVSGYVGKWVAAELLRRGYPVRGTLRNMDKAAVVRVGLARLLGEEAVSQLTFAEADLLKDDGWGDVMAGASAVMHVATLVLGDEPRDPEEVIAPAVDGTRRVLATAGKAGIDRVVMTSSIATVGYGQGHTTGPRTYTENNWTDLDNMRWKWAYCIGKTRAEREAWAFAESEGIGLTTIHPGMILGPSPDADTSVSVQLVSGLLNGDTPAMPNMGFSLSDVRDVAEMHVAALERKEAVGRRYLSTAPYIRFTEIADILRTAYPDRPITIRTVPDWLMYGMAFVNRPVRQIINDIGNQKHFDGSRGKALLGRDYRSAKETILDCAESLMELGLIRS